ncbi:DNA binding domain-containing protein, excisionase family [Fontibacillus panacisegetis]|uniref:DNA binding domain-containing protein, excisionase family n=1 Tax=Fontibacillus panacisegetis TaxID=670482 RepID=A0A1G7TPH6_9BACL|nr:DNA-binding protein [Fontibacillus panacisegetis]SDG36579.1 DNA binding domain-containing protein, excisionase family [Fontibacillus panacisegetis]
MLDYISVQQASEKWGISKRRIQKICEENRIDGAVRFGRAWAIPRDAEKPADARKKRMDMREKNEI